jgi:hypothetical protein
MSRSRVDSRIVTSAQKFEQSRAIVLPPKPSEGLPISPTRECVRSTNALSRPHHIYIYIYIYIYHTAPDNRHPSVSQSHLIIGWSIGWCLVHLMHQDASTNAASAC